MQLAEIYIKFSFMRKNRMSTKPAEANAVAVAFLFPYDHYTKSHSRNMGLKGTFGFLNTHPFQ